MVVKKRKVIRMKNKFMKVSNEIIDERIEFLKKLAEEHKYRKEFEK